MKLSYQPKDIIVQNVLIHTRKHLILGHLMILIQLQHYNLMISLLLKCSMQFTLCHVSFTVLKQFVLHVELLLHGQNLPMQKDLQTLCSFWRESIQQKNHAQIMFALTKLVWC